MVSVLSGRNSGGSSEKICSQNGFYFALLQGVVTQIIAKIRQTRMAPFSNPIVTLPADAQ